MTTDNWADTPRCNSTDTGDGTPCERPAGWGTESDIGPCQDHAQDHRELRKLTPEVKSAIMGAKRVGAFDKHAAQIAGITPNTLLNWKTWAKEDLDAGLDTELTEFYLDYQRAHAAGAVETLRECRPEFVAERAHGYTKTERHEVGLDTDHDFDAAESVTAEFISFAPEASDGDD